MHVNFCILGSPYWNESRISVSSAKVAARAASLVKLNKVLFWRIAYNTSKVPNSDTVFFKEENQIYNESPTPVGQEQTLLDLVKNLRGLKGK